MAQECRVRLRTGRYAPAGEVLGRGAGTYWSGYDRCLAFASHVVPADTDTVLPEQPDLSALFER